MAVKTITIDMEAYGLLSLHKTDGRSFSEVIKAHFEPLPTVGRFKAAARATRISQETLDIMDGIVRARANDPARAAR
jgi:predicted CopG family antitoxin